MTKGIGIENNSHNSNNNDTTTTTRTSAPIFNDGISDYSQDQIIDALKRVGIKKGDSIFVHSSLKSFGKICKGITKEYFLNAFLASLTETVGTEGNIIMPTFSYSFCKNQTFDPQKTPSTVGILTESFRKMKDVKRSTDPIFSIAVLGKDSDYFASVGTNCFGKNSIFEKLYYKDVKLMFIGDTFDITYMHFVEQKFGVTYRFIKKFKGIIKMGDSEQETEVDYNVRPLDKDIEYDLEAIASHFDRCGILRKTALGNSKIRVVGAVDAHDAIMKEFKTNECFLLKTEK